MPRLERISDHLYRFPDTCNVYVLTDGDEALLIDAGSGAVLDHLGEIGVMSVAWGLHTHHHRDQCWGDPRLVAHGARIAVPEHERHLFEQAELFWQAKRVYDNYNDRNTFFTIGENIPVAATLDDYETFTWRGYRFHVLPAKGHTGGSSMLLAEIDGRLVAFTGDLMAAGGRLYQLHAMEYGYSELLGVVFTLQSIQALRRQRPALALPSHGDLIVDPLGDIDRLERRLMDLVRLGGGMRIGGRPEILETSYLPDPRFVPVSAHLLWGGMWTCSNFYVILSRSGKALFIDYGNSFWAHMQVARDREDMEVMRFVEHHLDELREDYGVTAFDLVIPTHIHDDHTVGIPHLQRHYGTKCWALREVGVVLGAPAAWASTPCLIPKPIRVDRWLEDGEAFAWEEYTFRIYYAPGQTEYHSVIAAEIDGRRVAFTGDNYFLGRVLVPAVGEADLPYQTTVLRNSFQLGMHRRCADVMREIMPDLVCPGHWNVLPCNAEAIARYCDFIARKERAFRSLVAEPADQYIDLFWVRLLPYLAEPRPGETVAYRLLVRNNMERRATFEARLLGPRGWATPSPARGITLDAGARGEIALEATAPARGDDRRALITAEVLIDGTSRGPIAEALVRVRE